MFGRRRPQEDDPFAALRDGGTYQSTPTSVTEGGLAGLGGGAPSTPTVSATAAAAQSAAVVPSAPAWTPPQPAMQQSTTRYRRSFGFGFGLPIVIRLVIPLIVIGSIAVVGAGIKHAVHTTVSVPSFNFGTGPSSTTPSPTPQRPSTYLSSAGLRAGLARVEHLAPGARLTVLRIDANTLSATVVVAGGHGKVISFSPSGEFVISISALTGMHPVSISQIHPSAVNTLLAALKRRFHVQPAQVNYMVVSSPPGIAAHWVLFSKSGVGFTATLTGADLKRIG